MGRIRTIKPEFPQSESMGRVSRESRLCFILLFTLADDSGRLRGNSRMLASLLYPYDDDAKKHIGGWLAELHKEQCITCYDVEGDSYIELNKWGDHQKIDKPTPSKLPCSPTIREDSREFESPLEKNAADRKGMEGNGRDRLDVERSPAPDGVCVQVWTDFVRHRKALKAPLTDTAIDGFKREAIKAGVSLEQAFRTSIENNWRGFKADWLDKNPSSTIMAGVI